MATPTDQKASPQQKPATTATLVLAFASVYFFWGSTYTAIRIGAAEMPALLLAGTRFLIAGALLLAWCRWRGLRLAWPPRTMLMMVAVGLLLLGGGNVGLSSRALPLHFRPGRWFTHWSGFGGLFLTHLPAVVVPVGRWESPLLGISSFPQASASLVRSSCHSFSTRMVLVSSRAIGYQAR